MITIDKLIRTKRRSIAIQISSDGELIVRAPTRCSYKEIERVVSKRINWIRIHQDRILQNKLVNSNIISYKEVMFLGTTKPIIFSPKAKKIEHHDSHFVISEKYIENAPKIKRFIVNFMIKNAQEILKDRVNYFANLMQLLPQSLSLTNSKRVWGSCSKNADIKLNWRLVMLPPDLIDYVVVHELAHIVEFNHSQTFWKLVTSILPDGKYRRAMLKKGDFLLNLYR